ncbi:hypothetical protein GCM10018787_36450 [Streptomyces thermodiastaticus]|nr:hypothetical protein GCM10018787_36450 [Streptomyces thermodiastaticus]
MLNVSHAARDTLSLECSRSWTREFRGGTAGLRTILAARPARDLTVRPRIGATPARMHPVGLLRHHPARVCARQRPDGAGPAA